MKILPVWFLLASHWIKGSLSCTEEQAENLFSIRISNESYLHKQNIFDTERYYQYFYGEKGMVKLKEYRENIPFLGEELPSFFVLTIKHIRMESIEMMDPRNAKNNEYGDCPKLIRELRVEGNPELRSISLNFTNQMTDFNHIRIFENSDLEEIKIANMADVVTVFIANNPQIKLRLIDSREVWQEVHERRILEGPDSLVPQSPFKENIFFPIPYDFVLPTNASGIDLHEESIVTFKRISWISDKGECIFFNQPLQQHQLLSLKNCTHVTGDLVLDGNLWHIESNENSPEMIELKKQLEVMEELYKNQTIDILSMHFSNIISELKGKIANLRAEPPLLIRTLMNNLRQLEEVSGCLKIRNIPLPNLHFLRYLKIKCKTGTIELKNNTCQRSENDQIFENWRRLRVGQPIGFLFPTMWTTDFGVKDKLPLDYDAPCSCRLTKAVRNLDELKDCERIEGDLEINKYTVGDIPRRIYSVSGCIRVTNAITMTQENLQRIAEAKTGCHNGIGYNAFTENHHLCGNCDLMKENWKDRNINGTTNYTFHCSDNCWCREPNIVSILQLVFCKELVGHIHFNKIIYDGKLELNNGEWDGKYLEIDRIRGSLTIEKTNLTTLTFLRPFLAKLSRTGRFNDFSLKIVDNPQLCESEAEMVLLERIKAMASVMKTSTKQTIENNCDCRMKEKISDFAHLNSLLSKCEALYGNLIFDSKEPIKNEKFAQTITKNVTGSIIIVNTSLTSIDFLKNVRVGSLEGHGVSIQANRYLCGGISTINKTFRAGCTGCLTTEIHGNCGCHTFQELKSKNCHTWVGNLDFDVDTDFAPYKGFEPKITTIVGHIHIMGANVSRIEFLDKIKKIVNLGNEKTVRIIGNKNLEPIKWNVEIFGGNGMQVEIYNNKLIAKNATEEILKYKNVMPNDIFVSNLTMEKTTTTVVYPTRKSFINEAEWAKVDGLTYEKGVDYDAWVPKKKVVDVKERTTKKPTDSRQQEQQTQEKENAVSEEGIGATSIVLIVLGILAILLIIGGAVAAVLIVRKKRNSKKKKPDPAKKPLLGKAKPSPNAPQAEKESPAPPGAVGIQKNAETPTKDAVSKTKASPQKQGKPSPKQLEKTQQSNTQMKSDENVQKTTLMKSKTGSPTKEDLKGSKEAAEKSKEQQITGNKKTSQERSKSGSPSKEPVKKSAGSTKSKSQ